MDLASQNDGNPFGGQFGLKQPTVLAGNFLFSSRDDALTSQIAAAYLDQTDSLADNSDYQTAAGVFADSGQLLRQAYFINPTLIGGFDPGTLSRLMPDFDPANLGTLPAYRLAVFADLADADGQYATVVLIYDSEADAQAAVDAIPKRLDLLPSIVRKQPLKDVIADRGAVLTSASVVTDSDTGKSAAVIMFTAPLPPDTPNDNGLITDSGLMYRLLLDMIFQRDTLWLASDINPIP
ncbi:MAG TPA: hypothetical protein VHL11_08405, partial [Phototrophicaceae bacterium]|jgi:hypothetical protein|nr:hypothetical protein [Phototrophicaceae bacterium]